MITKHVLVLGGGFAGLECAKRLRSEKIRVTLVDRWNHHLFQPLLYQVASGGLAMAEIAQPLRSILSHQKNVTTIMDDVVHIDLPAKQVRLKDRVLGYDYLVIALGAKTSFFGHDDWAQHTLGLKSLDDAMAIRKKVLLAFEKAESAAEPAEVEKLLTMVVVGGGPTGVEMAGSQTSRGSFLKKTFAESTPHRRKSISSRPGRNCCRCFPVDFPIIPGNDWKAWA